MSAVSMRWSWGCTSQRPLRPLGGSPLGRVRANVAARANPAVQEFAELTEEEILEEVENCKRELFNLRLEQSRGNQVKANMFKAYRKKAAQLLTVKRQKEIEQGIGKRESRKREKNRLLKEEALCR